MGLNLVSLNAGCGADGWGDVRVDLKGEPTVFASIEHLSFRESMFDRIRLWEVLEHLNSPVCGLRELRRVSRGVLSISVPNVYYYKRILRTIKRGWRIPVNYRTRHLQVWDVKTMRQLLHRVGLRAVWGRFSVFSKYLELVVK